MTGRRESREEIAAHYCKQRGAVMVPPFEHRDVIAGQGTAGLELAEEAAGAVWRWTMFWCAARVAD